jgi:hypothetical protein
LRSTDIFLQGLRDLGYIEGQNITVEWRWGRGTTERVPESTADVVRLKVDVIVAANIRDSAAQDGATGRQLAVEVRPPTGRISLEDRGRLARPAEKCLGGS